MKKTGWRQTAIHRIFLVMSIFLVTVMSIFYIWLKVRVGLLAGEIEQLRQQQMQLIQENYHLKGQVVHLSSYDRITQIAQNQLGMVFIRQEVLSVKPDVTEKSK